MTTWSDDEPKHVGAVCQQPSVDRVVGCAAALIPNRVRRG